MLDITVTRAETLKPLPDPDTLKLSCLFAPAMLPPGAA